MKSSTFEINSIMAFGRELPLGEAIKIDVTKDEEYYLAVSKRLSIHGTGDTVEDAITDYMEEFIRYLDWLTENEAELAPVLQKELNGMRSLSAGSSL